jgi:predicted O-methyltransferase YrrM
LGITLSNIRWGFQHISAHHAWGTDNHELANYMISPLQAQFQLWMAKAIGAKRILEIGTFIGFSAKAWSHAVGPEGHVTSLEFNPEFAKIAEETWDKNGIANTEVIVGDARESLKSIASTLKTPYDLIFIDADKGSYPTYLSLFLSLSPPGSSTRLLKLGGVIMVDNILRRALVADPSDANPWSSKLRQQGERVWKEGDIEALDEFNKALVADKRLETFLMPMFDGLGLARMAS